MNIARFLYLSFFFSLSGILLQAQKGTVVGKVFDIEDGELLMFVSVVVEGSTKGTSSDLDGNYRLELDPGTYTLTATYVSYANKIIEDVVVNPGEVLTLDIPMMTESTQLSEVVVKSKALKNTEGALIMLRRKAEAVQDGISSQEIKRLGSSNAAESMKSVTGASVLDGKYVYLRGIGDRYNSTTLNNQSLPSVDPYRNATQLDMIPANLLDNLIASKTFTPDQPGNSTGGNLNITTKSFPEDFTMSLSMSSSYNTVSSLQNNFLTYEGGAKDWVGFDDGSRELPNAFRNPEMLSILSANSGSKMERSLDKARHLINPFKRRTS